MNALRFYIKGLLENKDKIITDITKTEMQILWIRAEAGIALMAS